MPLAALAVVVDRLFIRTLIAPGEFPGESAAWRAAEFPLGRLGPSWRGVSGHPQGHPGAVDPVTAGAGANRGEPAACTRSDASSAPPDVFRPLSPRHPHDESWPGLLLLARGSPVFFAYAHGVLSRMRREGNQHQAHGVVLEMQCRRSTSSTPPSKRSPKGEQRLEKEESASGWRSLTPRAGSGSASELGQASGQREGCTATLNGRLTLPGR